jgi:hypothetical protein
VFLNTTLYGRLAEQGCCALSAVSLMLLTAKIVPIAQAQM